jgi:hypothetical protein
VFIPEYLISAKVLQNISAIEYSKAIIDTTPLLENLELQLVKKTKTEKITALLKLEGYLFPEEFIKKRIENLLDKSHVEVENVIKAIDLAKYLLDDKELEVESLKLLHKSLADKIIFESGNLRDTPDINYIPYEEILAKLYDVLDWFYSKDARDTHPLIACNILLARLIQIKPFKRFNACVLLILFDELLTKRGYSFKSYASFVDFFSYHFQKNTLEQYIGSDEDLTHWLEFVTEGMASIVYTLKEEVMLLAKDTKIAKTSGLVKLTQRQQRILEYIEDYGILRNKDFAKLFSDISEDSVLRDLKALISQGLIIKTGSTKSSCYVLKDSGNLS